MIKPSKDNHVRTKRNAKSKRAKKSENRNPMLSTDSNPKSCRIQTLYVSFKDLKWHDWIIAPGKTNKKIIKLFCSVIYIHFFVNNLFLYYA